MQPRASLDFAQHESQTHRRFRGKLRQQGVSHFGVQSLVSVWLSDARIEDHAAVHPAKVHAEHRADKMIPVIHLYQLGDDRRSCKTRDREAKRVEVFDSVRADGFHEQLVGSADRLARSVMYSDVASRCGGHASISRTCSHVQRLVSIYTRLSPMVQTSLWNLSITESSRTTPTRFIPWLSSLVAM